MKILITGSSGFIAKNLIEHLKREKKITLYLFNRQDSVNILKAYLEEVDFIFHLAGVNRPKKISDFYEGNLNLTKIIVDTLQNLNKKIPLLFSSSIQVIEDNDYGKSKLKAEELILDYAKKAPVYIYRLPNVFGKWSKSNYNSVIATWCYNLANNLEITVSNRDIELTLVYIDDVINSFLEKINNLLSVPQNQFFYTIPIIYKKTLGEIEELLHQFKLNREVLIIPNVSFGFERALYSTYLSYIPLDNFAYPLKGYKDNRGTFYEIIKTLNSGQFSLSTTKPGIVRGNHYHHTKNEKFLVVRGEALIEFRHIVTNEKISYKVSAEKMEIVEMIPGYTHNIKNIGNEEMILFLWANENYDSNNPDTYFLEV